MKNYKKENPWDKGKNNMVNKSKDNIKLNIYLSFVERPNHINIKVHLLYLWLGLWSCPLTPMPFLENALFENFITLSNRFHDKLKSYWAKNAGMKSKYWKTSRNYIVGLPCYNIKLNHTLILKVHPYIKRMGDAFLFNEVDIPDIPITSFTLTTL